MFRFILIIHCFLFAFHSIDASFVSGLGRLVNDSLHEPNCKIKVIHVEEKPHLCLFAMRDIEVHEELRYSYGPKSLNDELPWRVGFYTAVHIWLS